jgi:hypothetical protein
LLTVSITLLEIAFRRCQVEPFHRQDCHQNQLLFLRLGLRCSGGSRSSLAGQGCSRAISRIRERLGGCNPRVEPRLSFRFSCQVPPPQRCCHRHFPVPNHLLRNLAIPLIRVPARCPRLGAPQSRPRFRPRPPAGRSRTRGRVLRTKNEPRNSAGLIGMANCQVKSGQAFLRRMDHTPSNPTTTSPTVEGSGTAV